MSAGVFWRQTLFARTELAWLLPAREYRPSSSPTVTRLSPLLSPEEEQTARLEPSLATPIGVTFLLAPDAG